MYKSIQGEIAQQHRVTAGKERKRNAGIQRSVYAFCTHAFSIVKKKKEKN